MKWKSMEQLRALMASRWKPLISLFAALGVLANSLKESGILSTPFPGVASTSTSRYLIVAICLVIFIVIRFPRVAVSITRLILGSPSTPADAPRIFRGPRPYYSQDQQLFPGRQAEVADCWVRIQHRPFFMLEGESGCGKSSLLNAALIPQARTHFRVIECRVADDPFGKLYYALRQEPYQKLKQAISKEALAQTIAAVAQPKRGTTSENPGQEKPLLVCIDQFEELFATVKDRIRVRFLGVLKEAIEREQIRLVIAIRTDFSDLAFGICRELDPQQLILRVSDSYVLQPFRKDQASGVLQKMLEPIHAGDPLIEQKLFDFSKSLISSLLRSPSDKRLYQPNQKTVLPVELQMVGMMIESVGIKNFSTAGLRRLGGKTGLMRAYIEDAKTYVWRKTGVDGDKALLVLRQLIPPTHTKQAFAAASIQRVPGLTAKQVELVLEAFSEIYLVSRSPADSNGSSATPSFQYELMHDYLAEVLSDTSEPILQKARDAEERLSYWRSRTKAAFESNADRKLRRLFTRAFKLFAKPIPIIETLRLWRFATSGDARRMLRRNLRGLLLRVVAVALPIAGWQYWIHTDAYQIRVILSDAPVAQAASTNSNSVIEWAKALARANRISEAFAALHQIKERTSLPYAFMALGIELHKTGKITEAKRALTEALDSAHETTKTDLSFDATTKIALSMIKIGMIDEAKAVVEESIEQLRQVKTKRATAIGGLGFEFSNLARALIKLGRTDRAIELCNTFEEDNFISGLAQAMVDEGQISEAQSITLRIKNLSFRSSTLAAIARAQTKACKYDEALVTARQVVQPSFRSSALAYLTYELAKAGRFDDAFISAREIGPDSKRYYALSDIALAFVEAGKVEEGLNVASQIKRGGFSSDLPADIIKLQAKLKAEFPDMRDEYDQNSILNESDFHALRALTLLRIGEVMLKIEKGGDARKIMMESFDMAKQIQDEETRRVLLDTISMTSVAANIEAGSVSIQDGARELLTNCLVTISGLKHEEQEMENVEDDDMAEPYGLTLAMVMFLQGAKDNDLDMNAVTMAFDRILESLHNNRDILVQADLLTSMADLHIRICDNMNTDSKAPKSASSSGLILPGWFARSLGTNEEKIRSEAGQYLPQIRALAKRVLDEAIIVSQRIQNDSARSKSILAVAKRLARLHEYRSARLTADSCSSVDKLRAYTTILTEYEISIHGDTLATDSESQASEAH